MPAPQLHTYVEARLGRWCQWYHWGKRPGPAPVVSWYDKMIMAPNVQGRGNPNEVCPVDEPEAVETHAAVMALHPDLRDTIFEAYVKWGTVEQKMKALGIRSNKTYYNRLATAYGVLLGYFNDQAAGLSLPAVTARPRKKHSSRLTKLHNNSTIAGNLA